MNISTLAVGLAILAALSACSRENSTAPTRRKDHKAPVVLDEEWMNHRMGHGSDLLHTGQQMRPEGQQVSLPGRLCAVAMARSGKYALVKTSNHLATVEADTLKIIQKTPYPAIGGKTDGGSMHGLVVTADGTKAYVCGGRDRLFEVTVAADGSFAFAKDINLAEGGQPVNPLGIALLADGRHAAVARSLTNDLVVVDLASGKITAKVPVGVCPYGVALAADGKTAFVSNYGGGRAGKGQKTELSAGTPVAVDERSLPISGTVSVVALDGPAHKFARETAQIRVGLHPSQLLMAPAGDRLFVANVGADSVSVIDPASHRVVRTLDTKPDPSLPFGSLPDGLALSADGNALFVAAAGINAVVRLDLAGTDTAPTLVSAGWLPGSLCLRGDELFIANVKSGLQKVPPAKDAAEALARDARARENSHLAFALRAAERGATDAKPVPVPALLGEPSSIKHVVYVIKENRTYDQLLGDLGKGNGDPKLCNFDRTVVPNHKALASSFALLDNYYCNGVNSSDGHAWVLQGLTTPYREKDRDGHRCAYDFGTDALFPAACGFLWDQALTAGLSFRNYGELDYTEKLRGKSYRDFYNDWQTKAGKTAFRCSYQLEALRRYSCPDFPGWEMSIPDQVRADAFLKELAEFEKKGDYPNLVILYLPNDHTASELKANSYLADNDLALGRCVEGLTRSKFWKDMAVFVIEDDPQAGHDHVDGHRSVCLVLSPWTKRGAVVSKFYNENAVLHTIGRILGLAPLNQMVAAAPTMEACFGDVQDLTPYTCLIPEYPLAIAKNAPEPATGKPAAALETGLAARYAALDFSKPDIIHEDTLNRALWAETRPGEPYPTEFAGAHGKGLKALGLTLSDLDGDDDDDD